MFDRLSTIDRRYKEIETLLADPAISQDYSRIQVLAKERASLEELIRMYREYLEVQNDITEAREILRDPEMGNLAKEELQNLEPRQRNLEQAIRLALLPKDPNDEKDVIVEIRAGTGGEEAALFVTDLYRMYSQYSELRKWTIELVDSNATPLGGFRELIFEVKGRNAYSQLKRESGVHRVQRIPVTETGGRIHTSTATVAVLPQADEVELAINSEDLRIDVFHAGGAGGQNVNKVSTAIRITHIPTGMVVVCQDERSQLRNKNKAMSVLRARLLDQEIKRQQDEISADRRAQVGGAERAEKIRTYNFPQNRVSDHRINLTLHNLDRMLEGELNELIQALIADEQARNLGETTA